MNKKFEILILISFGLSGMAALIYEMVWLRALSYLFGTTVYALSAVTSIFLAGLAIGSYFGGFLADRRSVTIFAMIEIIVGIYGFFTILALEILQPMYSALSGGLFVAVILSILILAVPTILIGASFPIASRLIAKYETLGHDIGFAYSADLLGSAAGAVIAGFLIIPLIGINLSIITAASINAAAAMLLLSKKFWRKENE